MSSPEVVLAVIVHAAALLLGVAGAAKLLRPTATGAALATAGLPAGTGAVRAVGVLEAAIAIGVVVRGGRVPTLLLALTYLAFAGFVLRLRSVDTSAPCGCFGRSTPVGVPHIVLNLASSLVAAWSATRPVDGLASTTRDSPWGTVPTALAVLVTVAVLLRAFTSRLGTAPPHSLRRRPVPATLRGIDPRDGSAVPVELGTSERTVVLLLSSTCLTCRVIWDELRRGPRPRPPAGIELLVMTEGPGSEDRDAVARLAPPGLRTVMVDDAVELLGVPGAPWALLVTGGETEIEGTGSSWAELHRLLFRRTAPAV